MPNQPKTKARGVRVADPLWTAARTTASDRGETVTDVIVRALQAYVADDQPR